MFRKQRTPVTSAAPWTDDSREGLTDIRPLAPDLSTNEDRAVLDALTSKKEPYAGNRWGD